MPFDPGRGGGNNYNYSNPYAPQPTTESKKSNWKVLVLALIGMMIVGLVTGAYLVISKNKSQANFNSNSAVSDSNYVEVEIFDVEGTK